MRYARGSRLPHPTRARAGRRGWRGLRLPCGRTAPYRVRGCLLRTRPWRADSARSVCQHRLRRTSSKDHLHGRDVLTYLATLRSSYAIHPSVWKVNSTNFALREFTEVNILLREKDEPREKAELSSYENYTRKSGNYDKTREPVGTQIFVGCFAHAPVPLDRTVVLDAGCGTGSYSDALLHYVGRIEAVDMNAAMLEVASRKLAWAGDRISFHSSRIEELPFEDANLDGVMINQVLHHLPDDGSEGFPAHRLAFQEFARVLKPGGILTVSTCSQEQLRHGYWHYNLIPEAADALRNQIGRAHV